MRKILGPTLVGLAAAALVAGSFGAQPASAAGASADRDQRGDVVGQALRALDAHPGVARSTVEQEFHVIDTIRDADGTSHVRMTRTVHGLPRHRRRHRRPPGRRRRLEGRQPDPARTARPLGAAHPRTEAAATDRALAPSAATRAIRKLRSAGAPRLVIDADRGHARGWPGRSAPQAASRTARPAGCSATSTPGRARCCVARSRSTPPTAPASPSTAAPCGSRSRRPGSGVHAHRPDPRQRPDRRRAEQDRVGPLPAARLRLRQGRRLHQPGHVLRQRRDEQPRVGGRRRALRRRHDVRLLQDPARPQRHLR